jgi:hypothetical protein
LLDRVSLGKMMRVLLLAKDPVMVAAEISKISEVKVITEAELITGTRYEQSWLIPGYSTWLVDRFRVMSIAYKSQRPLALVLDQRHQTAVDLINHDVSARITDGRAPGRISHAVAYSTDHLITSDQASAEFYQSIFNLTG